MDTKRIFVLGNGFDLAHYLPTAYVHFMDAMMVVESCEKDVELGFDDLFQKYVSGECSDRDKDFFAKTKGLYKTDDLKLSIDIVKDLQEKLKNNGWFQHFKHHLTDVDTWIDFENEIENVLLYVDILFSKDFEHDTITDSNIKLSSGHSLLDHNIDYGKFLGDNLVQFSPSYISEMKFKSSKIQKILRNFSIVFKTYGSYEIINDFGKDKIHNIKLHRTVNQRQNAKENVLKLNSDFQEFEVNNLLENKYLIRFSTSYVNFNSDKIYEKLLEDLECFVVIFRSYINFMIHSLRPHRPFHAFGELNQEIEAIYTFNYSNTFERLYSDSIHNQLNKIEVQYIHGSAQQENIVLGISDLDENNLKKHKIYGFVKTFQKLINNTDYRFLDDTQLKYPKGLYPSKRMQYEIIIWGHSLDASDAEYIREMFTLNDESLLNRVIIEVWYHGSPHAQLANLMHIMGKDVIQEWMKKGWLSFKTQAPDVYSFNKASSQN